MYVHSAYSKIDESQFYFKTYDTMPIKVNQPEEYNIKQCEFTDSVFAKY